MTQFNQPPGITAQNMQASSNPSLEDFWAMLDRDNDRYVDRCLAEGKEWCIRATLQQRIAAAPIRACTYPARPVNGGSLERALPKTGQWRYEPKYNGWRALVHAPSGSMFNRYGERFRARAGKVLGQLGALLIEYPPAGSLERAAARSGGSLLAVYNQSLFATLKKARIPLKHPS